MHCCASCSENREVGAILKLSLLVCKCMKMVWQYKILVSCELLAPIIGAIIMVIQVAQLELDNDPNPTIYSPFGYDPVNLESW